MHNHILHHEGDEIDMATLSRDIVVRDERINQNIADAAQGQDTTCRWHLEDLSSLDLPDFRPIC